MRRVIFVSLSVMTTIVAVSSGCNRRVFVEVPPTCDSTLASDVEVPAEKAADILIVVDNSGSMLEEQARLAEAFINTSPGACPISSAELKDFARCGDAEAPAVCRFASPTPEMLAARAPDGLADCGFIQVLAAFENDFRIGVITTDVGVCDNRIPGSQGGDEWGFRPQRGCLQPNGPPGTLAKIISRKDLLDNDPTNDEIGDRFIQTLVNIKTFGSAIERGLDATEEFLDPATPRPPACANDLSSFIRDDAKLLVIYLTDEEDCSRASTIGACAGDDCADACEDPNGCDIFECPAGKTCEPGRPEFAGETCDDKFLSHITGFPAAKCYTLEADLTPVSHYIGVLRSKKENPSDVSVAVIAGGLADENGEIQPAGCIFDAATRQSVGGCFESKGNSNNPSPDTCPPEKNCCVADPGGRYYQLADGLNGLKNTICVDSFGQTMIKIAVFLADVDSLKLAEKPADDKLVIVEKAARESTSFAAVPRINGTVCNGDGWVLEADGITVRFCGTARPGPGERIRVRARGEGADEAGGPNACEDRGTVRP